MSGEACVVVVATQVPLPTVTNELRDAADGRRDDRTRRGHRFEQGVRRRLDRSRARRENDDIDGTKEILDFADTAEKDNGIAQASAPQTRLIAVAPPEITGHDEACGRLGRTHARYDLFEEVEPLLRRGP